MKVEQLFASHHVSEERKIPLPTLSFQGNAMYWWTAFERERDASISTLPLSIGIILGEP